MASTCLQVYVCQLMCQRLPVTASHDVTLSHFFCYVLKSREESVEAYENFSIGHTANLERNPNFTTSN